MDIPQLAGQVPEDLSTAQPSFAAQFIMEALWPAVWVPEVLSPPSSVQPRVLVPPFGECPASCTGPRGSELHPGQCNAPVPYFGSIPWLVAQVTGAPSFVQPSALARSTGGVPWITAQVLDDQTSTQPGTTPWHHPSGELLANLTGHGGAKPCQAQNHLWSTPGRSMGLEKPN